MCEILVFKDSKDALLTKGKQAYKADLKSLELAGAAPANPVSHHVEKSVYISGPACINWFFRQIKKMTDYIKKPHTTIFTGPTGCGKTHLVLDLIEKEYNKHFDYIIIICPTLWWNKTYHSKDWIKNDDNVWIIDPKDKLYQWPEKLSQLLARSKTLFIIDDIIADEGLDKKGSPY